MSSSGSTGPKLGASVQSSGSGVVIQRGQAPGSGAGVGVGQPSGVGLGQGLGVGASQGSGTGVVIQRKFPQPVTQSSSQPTTQPQVKIINQSI